MDDPRTQRDVLSNVSLTERELEVLHLKARRRTNAEIAEQLFISITTVKWHVRQIYNKLGVNNRAEAVASARQLEFLDQKPEQKKRPRCNYPTPLTPFIGREGELRHLTTTLTDPGTRLVTVTGPGGIGKTRLALQAAKSLEGRFADGTCWVTYLEQDDMGLVFATVGEYITATIITALGPSLQGGEDLRHLLETYLHDREILIVLDGFEHLLPGAPFISELLAGTAVCKFLITSRERLNIPGEVLYAIQGLAQTQEGGIDPAANDAVNLFLQAASRVSKSEHLGTDKLPTIQRICLRLEGMPLGIELAADWTRLLPVEEIERELDRGFEFLEAGATNIRTVFDHSWNLLTDRQRTSFSRIAVFQRGFTREAARHIAGAGLSDLSSLFDKSLIQRSDESRYTIHDLLRQYAVEHLSAHGEREAIRDAHCAYFAALVADQMASIVSGDHSKILADLDNIRAAWRWAVKRNRLDDLRIMLFPMDWFYNLRAYYTEAMAALSLVIDTLHMPQPEGLQGIVYGKALASYGLQASRTRGTDQAAPETRQGLEILRHLGAREDLAWPLILSVFQGMLGHDVNETERCCLESLEIFEELADPYGIAVSLAVLGSHYRNVGRYGEAQKNIERGLAVSRSIGDQEGTAHALRHLGHLNLHIGNYETARKNFQEELALWRELSLPRVANEALRFLANANLAVGNLDEAEQLLLESLAEFEQLGDKGNVLTNLLCLAEIACQRGQPQEALNLLQDARPIMVDRQDNEEQARWWQLSGRVFLQQDDLKAARLAFGRALEFSLQAGGVPLVETLVNFAYYYQKQSGEKTAAHLLGFVQSQTGLPALLVQYRIDPLQEAMAAAMDEHRLALLLEEGAALDQQATLDLLADHPN